MPHSHTSSGRVRKISMTCNINEDVIMRRGDELLTVNVIEATDVWHVIRSPGSLVNF